MKKIIAIGAHSDDIEFYAGGTLAMMANRGNGLVFVVATDGRNGSRKKINADKLITTRKNEQERASKTIGAEKVFYLNFEDGSLEKNVSKLKNKLLDILLKEKPDIIFTFDPEKQFVVHEDFHPDHRALALAVIDLALIDITLPSKGGNSSYQPKLYLYNAQKPNKSVTIKNTIDTKRKALAEYKSQKYVLEKQKNHEYVEEYKVY
jgi:LmbE family N-acetylglucosaminyl deacetylase